MHTFYGGGINWTWYLDCEIHDDGTVTIHRHYRMHNDRHGNHPSTVGGFRIEESDPVFRGPYRSDLDAIGSTRDVVGVYLTIEGQGRKLYPVRNVKNVFAYGPSD